MHENVPWFGQNGAVGFSQCICWSVPIGSMYGIFTYIWFIFMANVAIYTIHRSYGVCKYIPLDPKKT